MAKIVIFGATEMAKLNHFYLTHDSPHEVVAFTVDRDYIEEETLFGLPVVPFEEVTSLYPPREYKMRVAVLYGKVNKNRAQKYYEAKEKGYELINYISSRAVTWPDLVIGDNCWLADNAVCQPFIEIGSDVTIMNGSTIGHDAVIGDHCFFSAQVAILGAARVGAYSFIGANATIRNNVTVGAECVIGAGGLIVQDVPEERIYLGRPAAPPPMPVAELKISDVGRLLHNKVNNRRLRGG